MTSTDKTGDKLVDSIRRTKAGTGQAAKSGTAAATATAKSATTAAKTRSAPASKAKASKAPVRKRTTSRSSDEAPQFTHGRRVWPD